MTCRRLTIEIGRDALSVLTDDEDVALAAFTAADGATVDRAELAQTLESLAAYLRTGALGPLPPSARVIGGA